MPRYNQDPQILLPRNGVLSSRRSIGTDSLSEVYSRGQGYPDHETNTLRLPISAGQKHNSQRSKARQYHAIWEHLENWRFRICTVLQGIIYPVANTRGNPSLSAFVMPDFEQIFLQKGCFLSGGYFLRDATRQYPLACKNRIVTDQDAD